jgi:PHS family inorganic phosphate transporter-like MFS transporter
LTIMLGIVYHKGGALSTPQDTAIKLSTSAGTVLGQVGFGTLADIVGRKKMYGLELILIIVATLAQSLVGPGPGTSVVGLIIFWRVLMGIGKTWNFPLIKLCSDTSQVSVVTTLCRPSSPPSSPPPSGEVP